MVEFESQSLWECGNFTNPLSNGQGSVGQCHALLPITWWCHPLYFFLFSIYHGIVGIYMGAAGRTGEELTKCKIITITRLISPIFRSLSAENVFPPSKTAIEMMNERSNLHEIAFLPNLFCICTEIMQAFASKSSLGTGYESYSRCNGYKLSLISSGFLTKKRSFWYLGSYLYANELECSNLNICHCAVWCRRLKQETRRLFWWWFDGRRSCCYGKKKELEEMMISSAKSPGPFDDLL